jgi:hypothetical protein
MMRQQRTPGQHTSPSPHSPLKQTPRVVEVPLGAPKERPYPPVAAPRQRVHARPLQHRALPPNVRAPESGDDWREIAHEVKQWLTESWQELHTNPRPFFGRTWQWIQQWWKEE